MISVVIVDDQEMVRTGLRMVLESEDDLTVVGEAGDGDEGVRVVRREHPDVVLMDIRMPGTDGLEATRVITGHAPDIAVIVLTTFDLDEYVYGALRAGASGFLLKDSPADDLIAAVRVVAGGDALIAPGVTKRLIAEFAARPETGPPVRLDTITDREVEVLELVARGRTNAEIADELFVGESTVKTHISHLLTKLEARDRVQLVVIAYESGLIRPGS